MKGVETHPTGSGLPTPSFAGRRCVGMPCDPHFHCLLLLHRQTTQACDEGRNLPVGGSVPALQPCSDGSELFLLHQLDIDIASVEQAIPGQKAGLMDYPLGTHWMRYREQLANVFYDYFDAVKL